MIKLNILPFLNSNPGTTLHWVFRFGEGILFPLNGVINDKSMCDGKFSLQSLFQEIHWDFCISVVYVITKTGTVCIRKFK